MGISTHDMQFEPQILRCNEIKIRFGSNPTYIEATEVVTELSTHYYVLFTNMQDIRPQVMSNCGCGALVR